jgi:stage II sporulation protein D
MQVSPILKHWQNRVQALSFRRWNTYKWLFFPFLGLCLAAGGGLSRQMSDPQAAASPPMATTAFDQISPEVSKLLLPSVLEQSSDAADAEPDATIAATPAPDAAPVLSNENAALQQQTIQDFQQSLASVDSMIEMRVAIAEGVSSLTVGTSSRAEVMNEQGEVLYTLAPGEAHSVQPSGQSLVMGSMQLPPVVLVRPDPDGLFYLGDRPYRGQLLLIADGGRLWAVNFVNMQSYLYSVVGSEVSPSWNMQALKAQAVAARSYALTYYFRPINSIYHLGATEYYQVYSGTSREADTIRQAVDATQGQFVSYKGGIVESLYAASDDIVMEAFRGAGMSQLGALDFANRGYSYTQILGHYYPGTNIAQIAIDPW